MKKLLVLTTFVCSLSLLQGCSAVMAASGTKESNLSSINKGDSKSMVCAKVGQQPARVVDDGTNLIEIYELERGNEPSSGRAIANGALSLFTLGIWEIVGTPIEVMNGEKYYLTAYYNEKGELTKYDVSTTKPN